MGRYKIEWKEEALLMIDQYIVWYRNEMSDKAARKFLFSIEENVKRISKNPDIGRREAKYEVNDLTMRSILIYRYYRILYGYNEKQLFVIALWDVRSINN